jgi:proteasome lid subunit RPN8/RPN11
MHTSWMPPERLTISRPLWRSLIAELETRGDGRREAGAFLLASPDRRVVEDIVYFDDLDPDCLVGSISMSGDAFSLLWDHCEANGQRVIADVHTHPGASVALSPTDRSNPMIATVGHIAIVVPHFAGHRIARRQLGFHCFQGDAGWTSAYGRAARRRVKLTLR